MAMVKTLCGAAGLAVLLGSTAQAAVTAQQVWQSWQEFSASMGQNLSAGAQDISAGVLTVTDVTVTGSTKQGSVTGTIDKIIFAEQGDGTVSVTLSPEYPVIISGTGEDGKAQEMRMRLRQTDLKILVSGDAAAMTYDLAGPKVALVLDELKGPDIPGDVTMEIALNGLIGTYAVSGTGQRTIVTAFNAENVTLTAAGDNPADNTGFEMNAVMQDVRSNSEALFPPGTDLERMSAALQAGFTSAGGFAYGQTEYTADFLDQGASTGKIAGTAAAGTLDVTLNRDVLRYSGDTTGTKVTVTGSALPVPQIAAEIANVVFDLTMPVSQSDVPQDFALLNRIEGLTLSEEVWALFDPTTALPRTPATLIVDLAGKGNWLVDMFAIDAATPPDTVPGEITALSLRTAQLTVAGADLQASGDVTFDKTEPGLDGMPRPVGIVNAALTGGTALLDKLVQIGVLPNEQAMGARMMLGLFARPGEGPDTLTSQVEFKADGSVFANGQQIR